ncbi:MAG: hypothetical protein EZS28_047319, partial [Streblomastix strix]
SFSGADDRRIKQEGESEDLGIASTPGLVFAIDCSSAAVEYGFTDASCSSLILCVHVCTDPYESQPPVQIQSYPIIRECIDTIRIILSSIPAMFAPISPIIDQRKRLSTKEFGGIKAINGAPGASSLLSSLKNIIQGIGIGSNKIVDGVGGATKQIFGSMTNALSSIGQQIKQTTIQQQKSIEIPFVDGENRVFGPFDWET